MHCLQFSKDESPHRECILLMVAGNPTFKGTARLAKAGRCKYDLLEPLQSMHCNPCFQDKLLIKKLDVKIKVIEAKMNFVW